MLEQRFLQILFLTPAHRQYGAVVQGNFAFADGLDMGQGNQIAPMDAKKAVLAQLLFIVGQVVSDAVGILGSVDQDVLIL